VVTSSSLPLALHVPHFFVKWVCLAPFLFPKCLCVAAQHKETRRRNWLRLFFFFIFFFFSKSLSEPLLSSKRWKKKKKREKKLFWPTNPNERKWPEEYSVKGWWSTKIQSWHFVKKKKKKKRPEYVLLCVCAVDVGWEGWLFLCYPQRFDPLSYPCCSIWERIHSGSGDAFFATSLDPFLMVCVKEKKGGVCNGKRALCNKKMGSSKTTTYRRLSLQTCCSLRDFGHALWRH
jgi:hypothetical protein